MDKSFHNSLTVATERDIERQSRWEMEGVERGVQRYREALAKAQTGCLADAQPGVLAMTDMMTGLVPAIQAAREEALEGIANSEGKGRRPDWWWMIAWLPAEKLAVITARAILTDTERSGGGEGKKMAGVAINIGTSIKMEMEFEAWKADEKRRCKEDPERVNVFKQITSRSKKVDSKSFARWRKKLTEIERMEWTREQKLQLGVKLLDIAITSSGGWFEYKMVYYKGKTERRVFLSEVAKVALADINSKMELARPALLPMRCPPKPWVRVTQEITQ